MYSAENQKSNKTIVQIKFNYFAQQVRIYSVNIVQKIKRLSRTIVPISAEFSRIIVQDNWKNRALHFATG